MQTRAALPGLIASLLVLACDPGARAPRESPAPRPAIVTESPAPATASPAPATGPAPAAATAPTPLACTSSTGEPLGDPMVLGVRPGDWVRSLDDLRPRLPSDQTIGWLELERIVRPRDAFVMLHDPGQRDRMALFVLERVPEGYCVRAVWTDEVLSAEVALEVSDIARVPDGTLVIILESPGPYESKMRSDDPFHERRAVLAVSARRAAVLADTQRDDPFYHYDEHHWFFVKPVPVHPRPLLLVAVAPLSSMRWRFDEDTWTLVPCAEQGPGHGSRLWPC